MPKAKIDPIQLEVLLRKGLSQSEIAKIFNVSDQAVSAARKKLKTDIVRVVGLEKAAEVVDSHIDIMGQLKEVNKTILGELNRAKEILEEPGKKNIIAVQEIIIKLSAEIRKQGEQYLRVYEVWRDQEMMVEFHNEVLAVIEEAIPGKRDEIIKRLKEKRALRSVVDFD
jgi:transcriptional regulator with XRE-family HTH domain